jgi:hypothetical protein
MQMKQVMQQQLLKQQQQQHHQQQAFAQQLHDRLQSQLVLHDAMVPDCLPSASFLLSASGCGDGTPAAYPGAPVPTSSVQSSSATR